MVSPQLQYNVYPSDVKALMALCERDVWHAQQPDGGTRMLKNFVKHTLLRVLDMNEVRDDKPAVRHTITCVCAYYDPPSCPRRHAVQS
jgi:hypothetical protein